MPLTLLLFLILAVPFLGLAYAFDAGPSGRRVRARIQRVRDGLTGPVVSRQGRSVASVRRQPTRSLSGRLGQRLSQVLPRSEMLRRRLDQGGVPLSVVDFVLLCVAVACGVTALLHLAHGFSVATATGIGVVCATGVPHVVLKRRAAGRRREFVKQFPDAIDLIVRGVRAGLPVSESLQSAGEELPNQVGKLFQEVTGNVKLGKSLDEALADASERMPVPEFRFFVISLAIQQETGGNLAEILQNLVALMRRRSQVKLKIRALSSEARASAMIIGSLPFIMFGILYLINPDYVMRLFVDPKGWMLMGAGLTSLTMGLTIMAKMIRFDV